MPFVNEPVPDAAIERFSLPFSKGGDSGHYWTRDDERDIFLSGGLCGDPAHGIPLTWDFHFYLDGHYFRVRLDRGKGSIALKDSPFIVRWEKIEWVNPRDLHGLTQERFVAGLKEALLAYKRNGAGNKYTPVVHVEFGF